jgi:2-phosphosulfolactate phosphatase
MSKKLEVVSSPSLIGLYDLEGKNVVVVDILRATTTICEALNNGAEAVIPVLSVEMALEYKDSGYLLAAERGGEKVQGFPMGNSPKEYTKEVVEGKSVVLTTTNGTKCIHMSSKAKRIFIGSFLNLTALAEELMKLPEDLIIFCAGWRDNFNLEDFLFAGALANKLMGEFDHECDSTLAAMDLYDLVKGDLTNYIKTASHAKRFERLGIKSEVEVCTVIDKVDVVPQYVGGKLITGENLSGQS